MTTTHFADLSVSCRSVSVSVYLSVCLFVCLFFCLSGSLSLSLSLLFVCLSGSLSLSFSLSFIRACSISRTGCKTGPNDRNATYSLWCSLVVSAGLQSHGAKLVQRLPQPQRRPFPSHLTAICTTNTALTRTRSHAQGRQLHKLPHKLPC